MAEAKAPFLKRVRIENFRSIAHCDVALQPLTLLVGPNGSGKTNFLDALRLVTESLKRPWDELSALFATARDQVGALSTPFRRRFGGDYREVASLRLLDRNMYSELMTPLRIELEIVLGLDTEVEYTIAFEPPFEITEEVCVIRKRGSEECPVEYRVIDGELARASFAPAPPASSHRPYLTNASAYPEFRDVCDALRSMQFYCILPNSIRLPSPQTSGVAMSHNGVGLATILRNIGRQRPEVGQRIDDYLRAVLPGLRAVSVESQREDFLSLSESPSLNLSQSQKQQILMHLPDLDDLRLHFLIGNGDENVLTFDPLSMSDGTLHALGVLVALFQCRDLPAESAIPLVAIEEPEANLHPGAAEVLMDAMTEASGFTQVLATTHSPDFLDYPDLDPESLLVFDAASGETIVDTADDVSKSAIRDKLYSAGELMRMQQLRPRSLPSPTSPVHAPKQ